MERDKWSYEKRVWILRGSCIWDCHRRHVIIRVKIITIESCFWREKVAWWKESFPQEFRLSTTGKWTTSPLLSPLFFLLCLKLTHPDQSQNVVGMLSMVVSPRKQVKIQYNNNNYIPCVLNLKITDNILIKYIE